MNLLSLLLEKKVINADDVAAIENESKASGESVESLLVKRGVESDVILKEKGEYYNIPLFRLEDKKIPFETLNYIPEESALHYRFAPVGLSEGVLEVGVVDPDNIEAFDALNFISSKINLPFKVFLISEEDFKKIIAMYKGLSQEVTKALGEYEIEQRSDEEEEARRLGKKKKEELKDVIKEEAPVAKIVDRMLTSAVEEDASDIHVEPMGESVRVRFRVDGVLSTKLTLPTKVHSAVVSRVKILSGLRLDERRKPQDGRFSSSVAGRKVDFRVSTFPSYYGEKVVMRILDTESGVITLEDLGLSKRNLKIVRRAIQQPYGIVLISGPTGSGKTTTLYAMLHEFDREHKNVLSLEDPIEYHIPGINQSQVRPEIGYTFANGLRTALRQDPDIIMVGEIRDKETAELAIQAALTGHLVLSTIHTNNAIGVVPRLVEMGIDPYLIAPTLKVAMAQRLVVKLCPNSGKPIPAEGGIKMMIEKEFEDFPETYKKNLPTGEAVYEAEPTKECPTGTRGRIGVFEMFEVDRDIEKIILEDPTNIAIYNAVRQKGMLSMKEDAIFKAFNRVVPFKEVNTLGMEFMAAETEAATETKAAPEQTLPTEKTV